MDIETAIHLFRKLEQDQLAQNFHARGYARYIYFGVDEKPSENLQRNLNFGSDNLAFSYLSIGCSMFENNYIEIKDGKEIRRIALEKGAEFIEYSHFYRQNRNDLSPYYLLVGALAYYASSQYSKAFVLMKKVESIYRTDVSILTSSFLRKDFTKVFNTLNNILLDDNYILSLEKNQTIDDRIQVVLYAKAFANLMDFLYFGNHNRLDNTREILKDLLELLEIEREPSMWWVVRLLIIIVDGLMVSSLWTSLLPLIPDNEDNLTSNYITNLIFAKNPIIELFVVQRKALSKVLSDKGAVVSLPTSSGKTRIAEIAILDCLTKDSTAKVLYLAPFRSLAYEVENSINQTLGKIGLIVSQLYGNSQFSNIDRTIIEHANILVATPEKAKVILRANDGVTQQIKLVIIDEGHLLNEQERQVRNEMFIEELKKYVRDNSGKIILLSAVLPNTNEIAQWITDFEEPSFIQNHERVARQRLGLLEYKNNSVNLLWFPSTKPYQLNSIKSTNSFNNNFIKPYEIEKKRRGKESKIEKHPNSKKEAVALTVAKLQAESHSQTRIFKPILVFTAKAIMVLSTAEAVFEALKKSNKLLEHSWHGDAHTEWSKLLLFCQENPSKDNSRTLKLAKYGILCHKGSLSNEIKKILERLIRIGKPKIIVGTRTLGQGVNLGVSIIVVLNTDFDFKKIKGENFARQIHIEYNDFWNIVGRAGRAFIDTEGKILFATQNKKEKEKALEYFNNQPERAFSGLLIKITKIKKIADNSGIKFSQLIELIAENNFNDFSIESFQEVFDLIDDTLLSFHMQFGEEVHNLDDYFRQTLVYIQANNFKDLNQEHVISFLKARLKAIVEKIVPNSTSWKRLISSGLPLASGVKLDSIFSQVLELTNNYIQSSRGVNDKINLLEKIGLIMKQMPSLTFNKQNFSTNDINTTGKYWLFGIGLENMKVKDFEKICTNYFGYTFSWFLGAIANRMKQEESKRYPEHASLYEELALCCELGLPDLLSGKIYLAGINSRTAAREISEIIEKINQEQEKNDEASSLLRLFDINSESRISQIKTYIILGFDKILNKTQNPITIEWLEIFKRTQQKAKKRNKSDFPNIPTEWELVNKNYERLFVRKKGGSSFLCNANYTFKLKIDHNQWDYNLSENQFYFEFKNGEWQTIVK